MERFSTNLIGIHIGSEFGIICNQYLGFDPRFNVRFETLDGVDQIIIHLNEDFIPDFFGNKVSSVTGIVGKNGVGKSTTLRYIKELFIKENRFQEPRENDVIFFKDENSIKIYINIINQKKYLVQNYTGLEIEEIYFREYPKVLDRIKNFSTIFYSNSLETDYYEKETVNYYNISTGFLKENIGKINNRIRNKKIRLLGSIKRYKYSELKRQSDFLDALDKVEVKPDIPFQRVNEILMELHFLSDKDYQKLHHTIKENARKKQPGKSVEETNDVKVWDRLYSINGKYHDRFLFKKDRNTPELERCKISFYENIIQYLIKLIFLDHFLDHDLHLDTDWQNAIIDVFGNTLEYADEDYELFSRLFSRLISKIERGISASPVGAELDRSSRNSSLLEKLENAERLEHFFKRNWEHLSVKGNALFFSTSSNVFHELFDKHYGTALDMPFLNFRWTSLSAGEESLISYFSRLYAVLNDIKNKNVLMLIDEGDLYFHPEWQRDYIFFLLEFLNSELLDTTGIQIIITTHSPFIISDLSKENIILLVREDIENRQVINVKNMENDTFGGNIHTLFTEAFFLGDSVTSRFAKRKIKREVIGYLENDLSNKYDRGIEMIIDRIGEPVLKGILKERFDKKRNG